MDSSCRNETGFKKVLKSVDSFYMPPSGSTLKPWMLFLALGEDLLMDMITELISVTCVLGSDGPCTLFGSTDSGSYLFIRFYG